MGAATTDAVADWTNYGDSQIPLGPRLSTFLLQTAEWREAFLWRLVEVGDVGLFEAAARVYDLLASPNEQRAAAIGHLAGVPGTGKLALFETLRSFLAEWLGTPPQMPDASVFETLEQWHEAVMHNWEQERTREIEVVKRFATILDGRIPEQAHG